MDYGVSFSELVVESQADGSALTAAAAASMLPGAALYTFRPNFFNRIGKKIMIKASGRISTVVTTPGTARFDVRLGGTIVFDSQAIALATADAYTNQGWELEIVLTCRAIGSTGNLLGQGRWTSMNIAGAAATPPKGCLVAMLPWNTAPGVGNNFSTVTSQQLDVFFTQTVATGSLTCHQYEVWATN